MAKRAFKINGERYLSKPIDFNFMAEIDEQGLDMTNMGNLAMIRAYFAYCAGISKTVAGNILSAHLMSGENFDSISEVMNKEMDDSGFFQWMQEQTAKKEEPEESAENPEEQTEVVQEPES